MDKFTTITVEQRDAIEILSLDRPDALNAVTPAMADELIEYFSDRSAVAADSRIPCRSRRRRHVCRRRSSAQRALRSEHRRQATMRIRRRMRHRESAQQSAEGSFASDG